jgi:hypothetical protein
MSTVRQVILLAGLTVLSVTTVAAQYRDGSAEAAIIDLFRALYAGDVPAFERLTLPPPQRSRLTGGAKRSDERLKALNDDPKSLQLRLQRPFQLQGRDVAADADHAPRHDGAIRRRASGIAVSDEPRHAGRRLESGSSMVDRGDPAHRRRAAARHARLRD